MIISKNSKNITNDRDSLSLLADKFKEYQKHKFNVIRSINKKFDMEKYQDIEYATKKIYKDSLSLTDYQKLINKISGQIVQREVIKDETYVINKDTGEILETVLEDRIQSKYLSDFFTPSKQSKIQNCNTWGHFIKYIDGSKEIKQTKSNACGNHLLCQYCASRKASKIQKRIEDFFSCFDENITMYKKDTFDLLDKNNDIYTSIINNEFSKKVNSKTLEVVDQIKSNPALGNILSKNWYFSVLTVKNSFNIQEVLNHLKQSFDKIRRKIKHYKERNTDTVFTVLGAVYSIEITYNKKTGYHPHINLLMCLDKKIDDCKMYKTRKQSDLNLTKCYWNSEKLSKEWLTITKDSFITSCTPLNIKINLKENLMEILKYSLKFNSIPTDKLVAIYPILFRQRFFGTLGFMYGLGLDKIKIENFEQEERFYIDFVMNYSKGIYHFSEVTKETEIEIIDENSNISYHEVVDYPIISTTKQKSKEEIIKEIEINLENLSKIL